MRPEERAARAARAAASTEQPPLATPLAFLGDGDAFVRRFILATVLAPPPGMRGARPRWLRR
jgi:hypothetical protein